MKRLLPSIGWVLFGLLAIAAAMISAGRQDESAIPAADSYAPAGTAALYTLLQAKGYEVDIDRGLHPNPGPGEVAIAFFRLGPKQTDEEEAASKSLLASVKNGAVVLWLPIPEDFSTASQDAAIPKTFSRPDGQSRTASVEQPPEDTLDGSVPVLGTSENYLISATKSGAGYEIWYADGIGVTNRFIDKAQNAQVLLEALQAYAPPHTRVLFTEATFGNGRDPGLLRTIGAWAEGAWYQILFLFGVIIYTLNLRFGLPERYRPKQRGARELLDAITDTYTRAKASGPALEAASARTDSLLRSVLKLPRDAGSGELYRLLPEPLIDAIVKVKAASEMTKVRPQDALELIQKLEAHTQEFLGDKRSQPRRRAA